MPFQWKLRKPEDIDVEVNRILHAYVRMEDSPVLGWILLPPQAIDAVWPNMAAAEDVRHQDRNK